MSCTSSFAEDKIVGIIWQVGTKGVDGKAKKMKWGPKFRATPDGKIWSSHSTGVNSVLGRWNGDEENTVMTVTGIRKPEHKVANGEYEFVLIGKKPKVWQGSFKSKLIPDLEVPVWVRLVQD